MERNRDRPSRRSLSLRYYFPRDTNRVRATDRDRVTTNLRWLFWAVLGSAVSCAFLLETADVSGAVVGSVVLGAALGTTQTLTAGWISRRMEWRHPTLFRVLVAGYVIAAVAAASAMSQLVSGFGVHAAVWAILATTLTLFVLLAVLVVETKLAAKRPAAS